MRLCFCAMLLPSVWLAIITVPAAADVAGLRTEVSATSNLIHHYTFEGATDSERLLDQVSGGDDLSVIAYGTGSATIGDATGISFANAAFDGSTDSLTTYREGNNFAGGAGLSTVSDITLPSTLTVEAVIRPLSAPIDKGHAVMVTSAGPGGERGYFIITQRTLLADEGNPANYNDSLNTLIGDGYTTSDNNKVMEKPYYPGDWYYVVNTYSHSGGDTTITSYVANLTRGETTLTKVLNGEVASGNYGSSAPLGVGLADISKSNPTGPYALAFSGQIDEVALYDTVLGQTTIESHFDALRSLGSSTQKIVTFGDSTTAARAIDEAPLYGYTDQLRDNLRTAGLDAAVYNQGIAGNTTVHAVARLNADVRSQNPDTVVVQFGINDEVQSVSLQNYENNLEYIIDTLEGDGAEVILMTPNPTNVSSSLSLYAQSVRDVAAAKSVLLVDVYSLYYDWIAEDPDNRSLADLLLDNYHPNAIGHEITADALSALFAPPIPGDANKDGKVDAADAASMAANWLTMSGATWAMGDFNKDGKVNDSDAAILAANWQQAAVGSNVSVPEPNSVVLLIGALIALFSRRNRDRIQL